MLSWILLFPLAGFLINGLWYAIGQAPRGRTPAQAMIPGVIATVAVFASFLAAVVLFFQLQGLPGDARIIEQTLFSWITIGNFNIDFAFRVDALNSLFVLVITGVATLIHLYSMGYMKDDEAPGKYFAYLNLFCFSMLILVMGASLPIMFFGWEGVGLCSYLLIGFWYEDIEKAKAGKKAFVVNRVGDFGFLIGMFLIFTTFGTLDFLELREIVSSRFAFFSPTAAELGVITAIGLLLFLGCAGKSAQIPLFVWLPDAMAGPTPVSALIHAATMVTAGVYLVARLNFLYILSPTTMAVVAWIGALTALFAATIAFVQKDIKRVLAYSTVSQLGYMFLAAGVGAFGVGVFHVITHAFFKALLFLGAGSVILGMHHEQNMMKMGGLKDRMPKTYWTFVVGWLAICGIFPFSGFWSKDEILWKALSSPYGSWPLYFIGLLTALMTAFYMTRLMALTFWGKPRYKEDPAHPVHESPLVVVVPLIALAVLSAIGGFMSIPGFSWLLAWLEPVVPYIASRPEIPGWIEFALMPISVLLAGSVMYLCYRLYQTPEKVTAIQERYAIAYRVLDKKWYVDELYEGTLVQPIVRFSRGLWKNFDVAVIDRIVLGVGYASRWTGETLRVIQTGSLQVYAVMFLIGLMITVGYMLYGMV
jgi:NADH-quinone oxidoreductase subunit L